MRSDPQLPAEWRKFVEECDRADANLDEALARLCRERDVVLSPFAWETVPTPVSPHVRRIAEALYTRKEQAARDEHKSALKAAETKLLNGLGEQPPPD